MIDPNTHMLARVIHEQRIEEALQHRWRLFNRVGAPHQSSRAVITEQILYWLGIQFVKWGLKLQGSPQVVLSQPLIANRATTNGENF